MRGLERRHWRWPAAGILIVGALLVPPLAGLGEQLNPDSSAKFPIFLGTSALVLSLWAISYNLMLGYAGIVSFAHAAYYGVGAYTVAILFQRYHVPVLAGLALAPVVAALVGFLSGLVALRAVRLYFSLLTLAISQLLYAIAFNWYSVTGGDNGIHGLELPDFLSDYSILYYFVGAAVGVCLVLMFSLVRSPFGAALLAIRENRERARSVGINVRAYELAVFTIAAAFAGVAGGLYALFEQQAYPEQLYWTANAQPVVIALLGGIGSFLGPALGAFIYTVLDNQLSKNFAYQFDILLGGIVLAVVLLAPGGFASVPDLIGQLRRRFSREAESAVAESSGHAIEASDPGRAARIKAIQADRLPADTREPLLVIEGLSRHFGGLRAVSGVNLTVHALDRHAIIGPNGAGKSTLFNLITGHLKPTAGRVRFGGRDITGKPPHMIAKAGIGRTFQITMIFPKLTVLQNLQYAMLAHRGRTVRPFGRADRMYRDEALDLLAAVGLGPYAELPAGLLSHGDQRAIELAISLALGSRLVLLDEPTAGMSAFETQKAMELVRRVAQEKNLTLLFCEHDMEVVFGTAQTVTVMNQGQVLTQGRPEEIRNDPEVKRVYLGELEETA
ncbi:MAG: branched-chain amino acid ABC transporter ATP-binding protein/permease [Candidatus Dormibacteraeota bacterium]|uniref:Branched-chain amino acid ABC transporter ATP-binding protein/permease n=1 Tax=Candidatus Dormiibacter inghamiae TaxID=3127013 RepID=A0A934KGX8_9BACT|nr:branched-chain amino acid ABC transporter ATP-binding protein/permease [Candidatus Dormibacteraeota bacterium]MBJ7605061.1 branched-chain amino acid ABC transporter ATP-binding protein/permease [Candidatus Dormibacteraeota bacterium]